MLTQTHLWSGYWLPPSLQHVGGSKNVKYCFGGMRLGFVHVPIFQNSLLDVLVDSQRSVFGFPQRATKFSLDTNDNL